jgi:hypothetical protein
MKNWLFFLFLMSCSTGFAHQPDISTTMLYQRDDGKWMLHITSSLTAFQAEVRTRFSGNAYGSVEDFERLVLQHVRKNVLFCINQRDTLQLGNAFVKVGHETSVVFEVAGMPENIASVQAQNTSFKDIYSNQSALIILEKGFPKEHFVLNNDNEHRVNLIFDGQKLCLVSTKNELEGAVPLSILGGLLSIAALIFERQRSKRNIHNQKI